MVDTSKKTATTQEAGQGQTTDLSAHLRLLRKHWWIILATCVLTVAAAAVYTQLQTPIYEATATVLIEPEPPRVVNIEEVTPSGSSMASQEYYGTQFKLIESRQVLTRVIETLNLGARDRHLVGARGYGTLHKFLTVDPVKNTRLVQIKFEHPDPSMAADVANGVASEYVKYNLELKRTATKDALSWLSREIGDLRDKTQQSSDALQRYRSKSSLLSIQDQRNITAQKIMDLNRASLEAQNQRSAVEAKLRELSRIAKDPAGAESMFMVADNPLIGKLKAQATDLQIERSRLAQIYSEKYPDLPQIDAQLRQVNERMQSELQKMLRAVETEYKVAKAREESLQANVNDLKREAQTLNEKESQALVLEREDTSNVQLHETVLKRVKEMGVTTALDTNNVRLVEAALLPGRPIRPRTTLILMLSLVTGLMLGGGVAFVAESLDKSVRTSDDVERVLGFPVLSVVPLIDQKR